MPRKKKVSKEPEEKEILEVGVKNKYNLNFNKFKLTDKQNEFMKVAFDKNTKMIFVLGPAGTSKTWSGVYAALQLFNMMHEHEIIYVRTIAESGEKGLGSLPGILEEKVAPFLSPLIDKIEEIVNSTSSKMLISENIITGIPVNYLRGASWQNKIVLLDEAQNYSGKELITAITRIGENTKFFVCGDPMQSDINGRSGLTPICNLFDNEESKKKGIHVFKFEKEDIMRSEILKFIIGKLETLKTPK